MSDRVSGGMALPRDLAMSEGELRAEAVRKRADRRARLYNSGQPPEFGSNKQYVYLNGWYTWDDLLEISMDNRLSAGEDD